MKIRPVGAELFHKDGRTDMTKRILAFRTFANAPKTQLKPAVNEVPNMTLQMRRDVTVFQQSLPTLWENPAPSVVVICTMHMDAEGFFETLVSIKLHLTSLGTVVLTL
jgi:hypothetical protein